MAGCGCRGSINPETAFLVTLPGGDVKRAATEDAARVAVTLAGGGTWREVSIGEASGYPEV